MTPAFFTAALILSSLSTMAAVYVLIEHVLPSSRHAAFAGIYKVRRRHLESLRSWEARTVIASNRVHKASQRFFAEASVRGSYEATSERGGRYMLPGNDPVALALLVAEYPDGPPFEVLARITGCPTRTEPE